MKILKKMLTLALAVMSVLALTACGKEESEVNKAFNNSDYKKVAILRHYTTDYTDYVGFGERHGYMAIESDSKSNVWFSGIYEIRKVEITSSDAKDAFCANTVQAFAKIIGYKQYSSLASNELWYPENGVLFEYSNYVAYFVPDKDNSRGQIYLGKKFEYELNSEAAANTYSSVCSLVSREDQIAYPYGYTGSDEKPIPVEMYNYGMLIGYAEQVTNESGETTMKAVDVFLNSSKEAYTAYYKMEVFLMSLDPELKMHLDKFNKDTTE